MAAAHTPEPLSSARLRVEGLAVSFGTSVGLREVSLEVRSKQVVGVIGANGAGKTTLLNVVCGELAPDAGTVLLDGEPLKARPRALARHGIGRTVQRPELPGEARVLDHVLAGAEEPAARTGFGALMQALPRRGRDTGPEADRGFRDHAVQTLRELGLADVATDPIDTVSQAARARIAIARATIVLPRLLLLDEPGAGLGPEERLELAGLIRSYATRPGRDCSIVLVDHHFDLIARACDHVVVLDGGAVIASGTPDEIRANPVAVEAYLDDGGPT